MKIDRNKKEIRKVFYKKKYENFTTIFTNCYEDVMVFPFLNFGKLYTDNDQFYIRFGFLHWDLMIIFEENPLWVHS